jgi:hypothetical protein
LLTDDLLNGYKQLPIEQEYALYQRREFRVFQKQSFIPGGFRDSEVPFEAAFGDKDRLNMICLPSNAEVDRSFFMRLLSRNIYLIGVTKTPILADGILRPSGRFATHDIRHSAGQYAKQLDYLKKSGLSRKNFQTMHGLMDQWLVEMNFGISAIRDPALKEAVELQAFNFNHDRGFPLIPSVYLDTKFDNVSLILYYFQKTSGEGVPFDQPMKNLKRADEWLRKFWQGRLSEERTKLDFLLSEGS